MELSHTHKAKTTAMKHSLTETDIARKIRDKVLSNEQLFIKK